MFDLALTRRLMTIPTIGVAFVLMTVLSPALLAIAVSIDLIRAVAADKPWMTVRVLGFAWVYLAGELWAIAALAVVGLLPKQAAIAATYRLQEKWVAWNYWAVRSIFGLTFHLTGEDAIKPGPLILLVRHASLIDSLLPAQFVTRRHGIRFRYVLKKELLADPALDIAGNRLPNHFLDRASPDSASEREKIQELAADLGPGDGVLIYPEGTRYSVDKRDAIASKLELEGSPHAASAARFRSVLPPRPGGTVALLEAAGADVMILAHSGLGGFASISEIWDGGLVGSTVNVRITLIPRRDIPDEPEARISWLYAVWQEVDDWVSAREN